MILSEIFIEFEFTTRKRSAYAPSYGQREWVRAHKPGFPKGNLYMAWSTTTEVLTLLVVLLPAKCSVDGIIFFIRLTFNRCEIITSNRAPGKSYRMNML